MQVDSGEEGVGEGAERRSASTYVSRLHSVFGSTADSSSLHPQMQQPHPVRSGGRA